MSLQSVLDLAYSQLGVTESPPNSNTVIYNTDYYGYEVSGPDYPWCAVFLWDIFRLAGESQAFYGGGKTASCTELKNYYSGLNRWFTSGEQPKPGDIAIMTFSSNRSIQHCGLVYSVDGNGVYTIEGNTSPGIEGSQDNGGCVAYKYRGTANIVGFCRIIYSNETNEGGPVNESGSDFWSKTSVLPTNLNQTNTSDSNFTHYSGNFESTYTANTTWNKELVDIQETRDVIQTVDGRRIDEPDYGPNLLSYPSLVEAPYINVTIGQYTFGKYEEKRKGNVADNTSSIIKKYPNFITSLNVIKINGQVNMYTINLLYQIRVGDDPNFIDKILSTVGYGKIKISYGDYASPSFIYKEEEAIITKVTQKVNFNTSSINYTILCTSSALQLLGSAYPFPAWKHTKPSKVIKLVLQNSKYQLNQVFPGMKPENYGRFIADDDAAVDIPAKEYMDPLSYINYLVTYMIPETDNPASTQRSATYYLTIHDDSYADYSNVGGSYFKITKISSSYKTVPTFNTYTVDVGYPGGDNPGENLVMDFQVTDDNSWSLLYNYYNSVTSPMAAEENYTYTINDRGQLVQNYSPNVTTNAIQGKTTAAMKSWWTRMTEFPISATLVIKGLVRSAMLMTYLRVNSYFFGKKHISSGLYVITKQEDKIDSQGYRTILSLTRIAGADDYIQRKEYTRQVEVFTGNDTYRQPETKVVPFDEQVVSKAVEDKEIQKTSPWSGIMEFNTSKRWMIQEGCAVYAVFDQNGVMYTDTTKWPFVSIDRDESIDNRGFIIQRLSYFDTDDQYDLTYFDNYRGEYYFPQDVEACQADWVPSLGFQGRWVAATIGNQVYFHLDTYDRYDDVDGVTSGQFLPQIN